MKGNFYLQGFLTFFRIGLFTIGGGYAMIPLIEQEVVERHKWIAREEFLDMMALSQAMPGVFAINFSICIGNRLRGLRGSVAFASGVVLPSLLIILLLAMFFRTFAGNAVIEAVFKGIRPAVVALIAVPCVKLGKAAKITLASAWLPIMVTVLIAIVGVSPVYVIVLVAVGAYLYGRYLRES